jgi:electron transport complex protein RnfE
MGRVEGFASKQPLSDVIPDALGMGLGYTWVLTAISLLRELLGSGTIMSIQIMPAAYQPIIFFVLPPGGFFVFALFIALNLFIKSKLKEPKADAVNAACDAGCAAGCEGCASAPQQAGGHCGSTGGGQK